MQYEQAVPATAWSMRWRLPREVSLGSLAHASWQRQLSPGRSRVGILTDKQCCYWSWDFALYKSESSTQILSYRLTNQIINWICAWESWFVSWLGLFLPNSSTHIWGICFHWRNSQPCVHKKCFCVQSTSGVPSANETSNTSYFTFFHLSVLTLLICLWSCLNVHTLNCITCEHRFRIQRPRRGGGG